MMNAAFARARARLALRPPAGAARAVRRDRRARCPAPATSAPTSRSRTSSRRTTWPTSSRRRGRAIGAVNTLTFERRAHRGDNTDAGGLVDALGERPARHARRWCSARAAPAARRSGRCARPGADVAVWNRTPERAAELAARARRAPRARARAGRRAGQHHVRRDCTARTCPRSSGSTAGAASSWPTSSTASEPHRALSLGRARGARVVDGLRDAAAPGRPQLRALDGPRGAHSM